LALLAVAGKAGRNALCKGFRARSQGHGAKGRQRRQRDAQAASVEIAVA
jgi:hypothetical protein